MKRKFLGGFTIATLILSQLAIIPSANAAACSVTTVTVSGSTRYAKVLTGSGCTWTVPTGVTSLQYFIVGGGGGGGGGNATTSSWFGGGGGGAGGATATNTWSVTPGLAFTVSVGTGGSGGAAGANGTNGGSTSITFNGTTVTARYGEGGGGATGTYAQDAMSGDGGGNGAHLGGGNTWDGGGGGAGAALDGYAGIDIGGQGGTGGAGGDATSTTLLGGTLYFGGGGGGGGTPSTNSSEVDGFGGAGGNSVGGNGGGGAGTQATAGVANTGSGGGGGPWRSSATNAQRVGAAGSAGIAIFIYTKATVGVTNVTSTNADGEYFNGDTIDIQVTLSDTVTVTGSPYLPLETGSTDGSANYISGSGTTTLTFRYTVVSGQTTADLSTPAAASINLNGGSVTGSDGMAAYLYISPFLSVQAGALAYNKNIYFNATRAVNVTSPNPNGNYVTGDTLTIVVEFSGTVTKGCGTDFTLRSQSSSQNAVYTSGSGTKFLTYIYTVISSDSAADLDYLSTTSLKPAGCQWIADAYGSEIIYTLPTPGAAGSLAYNKSLSLNAPTSTVTLSKSGGGTSAVYRTVITLLATGSVAGKAKFYANGKMIPGCAAVSTVSLVESCSWSPATRGTVTILARLTPTSAGVLSSTSSSVTFLVGKRATLR
jgi:hypothetical protein